jgi:hypothetical protein
LGRVHFGEIRFLCVVPGHIAEFGSVHQYTTGSAERSSAAHAGLTKPKKGFGVI